MLYNLVSASNAENKEVLWGYRQLCARRERYNHPFLDKLTDYAGLFRTPWHPIKTSVRSERAALADLSEKWLPLMAADAETIGQVYAVGKAHFEDNLRNWFQTLYQVLLGQGRNASARLWRTWP